MNVYIYSSFIQLQETRNPDIHQQVNEQTIVHTYNTTLLSDKNQSSIDNWRLPEYTTAKYASC